ncbi:methionyl-tRNA formyltransferase [Campylobacter sputorum subsp. bubulus]|uniref:methionyl-tRNA formyltransferase n=1 Tax=Campylobacter sputorum subsp. sputorum TaxID=32024 RepID=A0A381DK18_9BACT|nr:methionyl-tRNA formyltransferase [Campylobacter sputorum]ASM35830.1 10-formyltetrahydrofolate:L-methionyl-tRNA(fMet) N-formyltransferase [Campylobacter sputorum aubsp. sputorum RM3237]KAB0581543.1 methionyl-tRNA formyltransferase [Campylobacter sputorum subsp. sputorum]QEL06020.1 10-formyltetrahydrofolate:L-methionyl-tRNA(fMet) N-formyltransferase [Campylobacter sputorum subsp. sputorum]SUX09130.1 methionyl-tRNA formyltransferase [Campylobacter sputorum subsp. bubulus]SUX10821.1 methionyl-t
MNIVFMGTPDFAKNILKELLLENFCIKALVCAEDKAVGRKMILTPPDTKKFILQNYPSVEILQPKTLKDKTIVEHIKNLNPDFIVVAAYGKILPKEVLDIVPCINLHGSILPKYRGASPIQSMILNADNLFGVTAMKMGEGLDNGDMLGFSMCENNGQNSTELFEMLSTMAGKLCVKVLRNYDNIMPLKQFDAISSSCVKIKKSDGVISFDNNIDDVMSKFKAYFGWPGIYFENGLKLLDIRKNSNKNIDKKGIITNITKDGFCMSFNGGELEILSLQEVSKKAVLAKDFINGKRLKVGDGIC